jgi:hypothetical protein
VDPGFWPGKRKLLSVSARLAWDFFTRSQVEAASQCHQLHALMLSASAQPWRVSKHALTFIHNGRRTFVIHSKSVLQRCERPSLTGQRLSAMFGERRAWILGQVRGSIGNRYGAID